MEGQRAFFLAANLPEVQPNALVKLGAYEWKVHSDVLTKSSSFFRAIFEGGFKESNTMTVELHDDDPFIMARAILFMYDQYWDIDISKPIPIAGLNGHPDGEGLLDSMMSRFNDLQEFKIDGRNDKARSGAQIQCLLIRLADKYDIPELLDSAWARLGLDVQNFWHYYEWIGEVVIDRHTLLQSSFVSCAAHDYKIVKCDRLEQWLTRGTTFSIKVVEELTHGCSKCGHSSQKCSAARASSHNGHAYVTDAFGQQW